MTDSKVRRTRILAWFVGLVVMGIVMVAAFASGAVSVGVPLAVGCLITMVIILHEVWEGR